MAWRQMGQISGGLIRWSYTVDDT